MSFKLWFLYSELCALIFGFAEIVIQERQADACFLE